MRKSFRDNPASALPALHPVTGQPMLLITMPWIPGAAWKLWIPEGAALASDKDRHFMSPRDIDWRRQEDRVFYRKEISDDRHYACGIRFEAQPVNNGVDLLVTVENRGTVEWPDYANLLVCLGCLTEEAFSDRDGTRTFVRVKGETRTVRDLVAVNQTLQYTHFLTPPLEDPQDELLVGHVDHGSIIRVSEDGIHSVVFWWDNAVRVDANFDTISCIHSHPQIGPLPPGTQKECRGWIRITQGDADQAARLFQPTPG